MRRCNKNQSFLLCVFGRLPDRSRKFGVKATVGYNRHVVDECTKPGYNFNCGCLRNGKAECGCRKIRLLKRQFHIIGILIGISMDIMCCQEVNKGQTFFFGPVLGVMSGQLWNFQQLK